MMDAASRIDTLYREHHDVVLSQLRSRFRGSHYLRDQAEDALSDTWAILARKLTSDPDYLTSATARNWLYVVAYRRLLTWCRVQHHERDALEDVHLTTDDNVHAIVINRERVRELLDFVTRDDVSTARRRAVAARIVGVKYRELGEMTGTTYTHVNRSTAEGVKLARAATVYAS